MGISPTGSNKKPRSTLIFGSTTHLHMFKNGIGDLASINGVSPSDAVLHLVMNALAKTDKGKALAQSLYGCDTPSCQNAYCAFFEELAALISPNTQDAKRLVKHFFRHSLDFGISINTEDNRAIHLRNQWDSLCTVLEETSKAGEIQDVLAAKNARSLAMVLDDQIAMQAISPFISQMLESWETIKNFSCTYRVLVDFTNMGFPTNLGRTETAETRLSLLKAVDEYYSGGEEERA